LGTQNDWGTRKIANHVTLRSYGTRYFTITKMTGIARVYMTSREQPDSWASYLYLMTLKNLGQNNQGTHKINNHVTLRSHDTRYFSTTKATKVSVVYMTSQE
jgi:hypothetical protein